MDWGNLLHNKWTWVTAGVGGAAGLAVLYLRRRGGASGGTSGAQTTGETAGYTSGSVGYYPGSASTDFAAQLGQAEQAWQNTFDQFQSDVADQLATIPTEPTGTGTGSTPTTETGGGTTTTTPPKTTPQTVKVTKGSNLYDVLHQYFGFDSGYFQQAEAINPNLRSHISWQTSPDPVWGAQYGKVPVVTNDFTLKLS